MTDDLRFERLARDWLELGPVDAPPDIVQAALLEIDTTRQERDLRIPWRLTDMPMLLRVAAAVIAIAIVGGGAYLFIRGSQGPAGVGSPGTATPAPPSPTIPSQVIPDGTYLGVPIPVTDILDDLASDETLNESERTSIIDGVLGIRGATTYQTRIEIDGTSAAVSSGVDGVFNPEPWTFEPVGVARIRANGTEFDVGGCDGAASCSFTLRAVTPAPSPVETFVRSLVFEMSGPFTPQP